MLRYFVGFDGRITSHHRPRSKNREYVELKCQHGIDRICFITVGHPAHKDKGRQVSRFSKALRSLLLYATFDQSRSFNSAFCVRSISGRLIQWRSHLLDRCAALMNLKPTFIAPLCVTVGSTQNSAVFARHVIF